MARLVEPCMLFGDHPALPKWTKAAIIIIYSIYPGVLIFSINISKKKSFFSFNQAAYSNTQAL